MLVAMEAPRHPFDTALGDLEKFSVLRDKPMAETPADEIPCGVPHQVAGDKGRARGRKAKDPEP